MGEFKIPNQIKQFTQSNKGELFGNLFASWNLDLITEPGKAKINPRVYRHTDIDDDAQFGKVSAIVYDHVQNKWVVVAGGAVFKSAAADPTGAYTEDTDAGNPATDSLFSDVIMWDYDGNGKLMVSYENDVAQYSGAWTLTWWSTLSGFTLNHGYHSLGQFNKLLMIGDGSFISTCNESDIDTYRRLSFGSFNLLSNGIRTTSDRVWFTTKSYASSIFLKAKVFEWDGYSLSYNRFYDIETDNILSSVVKDNVPYILTADGVLMGYTGGAFEEVARFPVYTEKIFKNGTTKTGARWGNSATYQPVHQNGMRVIDGKIHILVSAGINNLNVNLLENMTSGIWIFDENVGLYHAYSFSQYKSGTVADFGSQAISFAGAIVEISSFAKDKTTFLAGASLYTDNGSTEKDCLFKVDMIDSLSRRGYFITSAMESSEVRNFWTLLQARFEKLLSASDKIVLKYRVDRDRNLPFNASITWTSTTTFTSTNANFANAATGDEIETIQGKGSGTTVHISSISVVAGTYTITIDEAITGVTGTAKVLVQDWVKLGSTSDTAVIDKIYRLGKRKPRIQFKVEIRGTTVSPLFKELSVEYQPSKR